MFNKHKNKEKENPNSANAKVEYREKDLISDFILAVTENDLKKVAALIAQGIDVNQYLDGRRTALHQAATAGNGALVKLLLDNNANPNIGAATSDGVTPLYLSSRKGHAEIVRILLQAGANPNVKHEVGKIDYTPLFIASYYGHVEVVEELLRYEADTYFGADPLARAEKNGHKKIANILHEKRASTIEDKFIGLSGYDREIIIDFSNDGTADALKYKWDANHPNSPCVILNGKDILDKKIKLDDKINGLTRVYVQAHGDAQLSFLVSGNGEVGKDDIINITPLAQGLAHFIGDHPAVVDLVACATARGTRDNSEDTSKNSFAAQLHMSLCNEADRDVPVVAFMQDLTVDRHKSRFVKTAGWVGIGRKQTMSLDYSAEQTEELEKDAGYMLNPKSFISRQPGAKVIFTLDEEGNQIRLDAYKLLWKKRVLRVLANAADKTKGTSVSEKRTLLEAWLNSFNKGKSADQIYEILQAEVENPDSLLKRQHNPVFGWFKEANTYKQIVKLLNERRQILDSKHTKAPTSTGWSLSGLGKRKNQ